MEVSLASWRYRNILEENGGPIVRIAIRRTDSKLPVRKYEGFAYLKNDLKPTKLGELYGHADGTGSGSSAAMALNLAVSEAIERWAFFKSARSPYAAEFGFDYNCTTSGMAAFPGLTRRSARPFAYREAVERWSICAWWEGRLGTYRHHEIAKNITSAFIKSPWLSLPVAILFGPIASKHYCYSFACGRSEAEATTRAKIEFERNTSALIAYFDEGSSQQNPWPTFFEKRLLYFSGPEKEQTLSTTDSKRAKP